MSARPHHGLCRRAFGGAALALLCLSISASGPTRLEAQDLAGLPPVLQALSGDWEGSGTLFGNPAAFRMSWTPLDDGFVRLAFTNMLIQGGDTVAVLTAEATYRVEGDAALGVWIDDRPQQLTLSAVVGDSSVVTDWTAPAETGRTEYVVTSPTEVVVRDYVMSNGAPRLFAEGRYVRAGPGGR